MLKIGYFMKICTAYLISDERTEIPKLRPRVRSHRLQRKKMKNRTNFDFPIKRKIKEIKIKPKKREGRLVYLCWCYWTEVERRQR